MTAFLNKPGDIVEVPYMVIRGRGQVADQHAFSFPRLSILLDFFDHVILLHAISLPGLVPSARSFQVDPGGKSFNTAGVMSWFVGRLEDWKVLVAPLRGYPKDVRSKKGPLVGCFI